MEVEREMLDSLVRRKRQAENLLTSQARCKASSYSLPMMSESLLDDPMLPEDDFLTIVRVDEGPATSTSTTVTIFA